MLLRHMIPILISMLLMLSTATMSYSQEASEPIPIDDSGEVITNECACDCGGIEPGEILSIAIADPFNENRVYTFVMNYPDSLNASDVFASIVIAAKSKLQDCIDNVNNKCPEPTKKDGESEADFQ